MSKWVKIKVRSACLTFGSKDYFFDEGGNLVNRKDAGFELDINDEYLMDHPFNLSHVSNMLHVLLGYRPVPSNRFTIRERLDGVDKMALDGFVHFDNSFTYTDKKGKKRFLTEQIQGKKSVKDSNRKAQTMLLNDGTIINGNITWHSFERKMLFSKFDNPEKYDAIVKALCKFGECESYKDLKKKYSLIDLLIKTGDTPNKEDAIDFFKKNGLTPFADIIEGKKEVASFCCGKKCGKYNNMNSLLNVNSIIQKTNIDCTFMFPVDDDMLVKLKTGTKVAKFLEGGVAKVEAIMSDLDFDSDVADYENFVLIKNIVGKL